MQLQNKIKGPAIAGLFLVLFSGCGAKEPAIIEVRVPAPASHATTAAVLLEAKHADLPVPVGFRAQSSAPLTYSGTLGVRHVRDFYHKQMERLGWMLEDYSTQDEGLLICRKPTRTCVISLRTFDGGTHIVLFTEQVSAPQAVHASINEKPIPGELA